MSVVPRLGNSRLIPGMFDLPSGHKHKPMVPKETAANWHPKRATVKQMRLPVPAKHTALPYSLPDWTVCQETNRNVPGTFCHLGIKRQLEGPRHLHIQLCFLCSKVGVAVTRPGKSHTCHAITLHPPLPLFFGTRDRVRWARAPIEFTKPTSLPPSCLLFL